VVRILRRLVVCLLGLVLAVILASAVFDVVTSDPNVPVTKLWHGRFVEAGGVLTAYREWGSHGTPVVLVGGFVEPSFVWRAVGPLLARHHRVVALDLDGFGYSRRKGPWTLQEWTDQTQALIANLHLGRPIVVGHSLGAAVAVSLARRRVASRIVLLDGDALPIGGPPSWVRTVVAQSPFFTTAFRLVPHLGFLVKKILANAWGPDRPKVLRVQPWLDQLRAQGARDAFRGLLEHGVPGFSRAQLQATQARALVVWGAEDSVDDPAAGRRTARDLHARFVSIPGAGHLSMLARPRAVAAAIERG
jgi:pimeloyl-ACP methyl ester carboxylesterase